jgi:hypothetical protein
MIEHDEREVLIGGIIRRALEVDHPTKPFRLTCSVGELAERIVQALAEWDDADADFLLNYAAAIRRTADKDRKKGSIFGPECVDVQAPIFERIASRLVALTERATRAETALAIADEWFGCCDCITTEYGTDERKKRYWQLRRAALPSDSTVTEEGTA